MLVVSLSLFINILICSEEEGYFILLGPRSYIKHNYLSLNLELVKIKETVQIAKENMNFRNLYDAQGLSNDSNSFNKYNGFNNFLNAIDSGNSGFLNYTQDLVQDQFGEEADLLNSKYVPKVLSNYHLTTEIPSYCNDKIRIFLRFSDTDDNEVENLNGIKEGIVINFNTNEVILGSIRENDSSKRKIIGVMNDLRGRVGEYFDWKDLIELEEQKKKEKAYLEELKGIKKSSSFNPIMSIQFRVLEQNAKKNQTPIETFEPLVGKNSDIRPSTAPAILEKSKYNFDLNPQPKLKYKDYFNDSFLRRYYAKKNTKYNPEEPLEFLFDEIEKSIRQRQLNIFRFSEHGSLDGKLKPSISLEGILDSEKRYSPLDILKPKIKQCTVNFSVKYHFDRFYDSDENTTQFNLFHGRHESQTEELMNKYRESQLDIQMEQAIQQNKQLHDEIGKYKSYIVRLIK